jgi:hypothetical protein
MNSNVDQEGFYYCKIPDTCDIRNCPPEQGQTWYIVFMCETFVILCNWADQQEFLFTKDFVFICWYDMNTKFIFKKSRKKPKLWICISKILTPEQVQITYYEVIISPSIEVKS